MACPWNRYFVDNIVNLVYTWPHTYIYAGTACPDHSIVDRVVYHQSSPAGITSSLQLEAESKFFITQSLSPPTFLLSLSQPPSNDTRRSTHSIRIQTSFRRN